VVKWANCGSLHFAVPYFLRRRKYGYALHNKG
jgi:hypothetical protein